MARPTLLIVLALVLCSSTEAVGQGKKIWGASQLPGIVLRQAGTVSAGVV